MQEEIWKFIVAHSTVIGMASLWTVGAAVSSLPAPNTASGTFYVWFYKFSNLLVANFDKLGTPKA
jgi:hypothetical protein